MVDLFVYSHSFGESDSAGGGTWCTLKGAGEPRRETFAPRKGPAMNPTKPGLIVNNEAAGETRRGTLSITDNRTGRQFELPITNETMKAQDADFGMMSYDPAFTNTASCSSKITYIDGDKGILRYRGYSIEELAE